MFTYLGTSDLRRRAHRRRPLHLLLLGGRELQRHLASLVASAVFMILGFQVVLIGLVADAISGTRKFWRICCGRAGWSSTTSAMMTGRADGRPRTVSIVIPAFNEAGAIAAVITELIAAALAESSSWTMDHG